MTSLLIEKKAFSKVAVITTPGTEIKQLGFVTSEELENIGFKDYVAVYVLQSLQWSGNVFLVPKKDVEILENVQVEDVMKFIVSAGVVTSKEVSSK